MSENTEIAPRKKWYERLKNKYLIVSVFFIIWIAFFDQNNLIDRIRYARELKRLEEGKAYHEKQIKKVKNRLYELNHQDQDLVKFAREQYLMKRDNEDVYVIVRE